MFSEKVGFLGVSVVSVCHVSCAPKNHLWGRMNILRPGGLQFVRLFVRAPFRHLIGATHWLGVKLYSLTLCFRAFAVSHLFSVHFLVSRCHCSLFFVFLMVFSARCSEPWILSTQNAASVFKQLSPPNSHLLTFNPQTLTLKLSPWKSHHPLSQTFTP